MPVPPVDSGQSRPGRRAAAARCACPHGKTRAVRAGPDRRGGAARSRWTAARVAGALIAAPAIVNGLSDTFGLGGADTTISRPKL